MKNAVAAHSFILLVLASGCRQKEVPAKPLPPAASANKVLTLPEGFQTPASVLYDPGQDVYFISNINGLPLAVDDNGFISRVDAKTLKTETKWIDGARPDITLNGPKGMAIVGDDLYVSDIDRVRKFDRKTGVPRGEISLPGASFVNDLVADGNVVYASDSGLRAEGEKLVPTGTDAIWKISNTVEKVAASPNLKAPSGLIIVGGRLWAVTFGGNELYAIEQGKMVMASLLPKGSLVGLVAMKDGSALVSSWEGRAIYRGRPPHPFVPVMENVDSPGDIGYDSKRQRLLVPHEMANSVTIHVVR